MTFQTNLANSQKIKELIGEIETEKYWVKNTFGWTTDYIVEEGTDYVPCPNLSELAEVLKLVGEKKGWQFVVTSYSTSVRKWISVYSQLCQLWASCIYLGEEKANEVVNKKLAEILNQ